MNAIGVTTSPPRQSRKSYFQVIFSFLLFMSLWRNTFAHLHSSSRCPHQFRSLASTASNYAATLIHQMSKESIAVLQDTANKSSNKKRLSRKLRDTLDLPPNQPGILKLLHASEKAQDRQPTAKMLKKMRRKQRQKERKRLTLLEKAGKVEASGTQLDTQRTEGRSEDSTMLSPHDTAITPTSGIKLEGEWKPDSWGEDGMSFFAQLEARRG